MKSRIFWTRTVWEIFQELSASEQKAILDKLALFQFFPYMCPVRNRGRFRRHRWFHSGNWLVYYKVADRTVWIRGLWPAQVP